MKTMPADRTGNTMLQARNLSLRSTNTNIREWVGNTDPADYFTFSLGQRSRLFTGIRGRQKGVRMELLQDTNSNGRLDARDLIGQRSSRNNQLRRMNVNLAPGTYFLRISRNRGNSRYRMFARTRTLGNNSSATSELGQIRQEILQLVNQQRRQNNLSPVRLDSKLNAAAQTHSVNMALQDFFGHTGQDGSSSTERVRRTGYNGSRVAENIAAGHNTAASVVAGWMNSPGHRANILDPNANQMGLGYRLLSNDTGKVNYRHYWTQVFARSR